MTKHIKLFSRLLFLVIPLSPLKALSTPDKILSTPGKASSAPGDEEVEKRKTISKTYPVTAEDKLRIENSFGNVVINTWDKNEIKVDVDIMVRSSTEEKAKDLLDGINIQENREGHLISYKTNIGDMNEHKGKNGNNGNGKAFHIHYNIYMPSGNHLQIENSFGKTTVPDFNGEVNLTSKFGGLTAGKLTNVEAIDVEFGAASIGAVHNGKLNFKFDKESTIGNLSGSVKINIEFSHRVQFTVDDHIEDLSVNESYSTLRVVVSKDLSAGFDIHTSFGNIRNETGFAINEKRDDDNDSGPHFDKDYSGKAGEGKARIKIKSSFGTVKLSHTGENTGKDKDNDSDHYSDDDQKESKEPA